MAKLLPTLAIFPIAASICCCGCCDLWDGFIDLLNPGRERAEQVGGAWLKKDPAARRSFGTVQSAERNCFGAFAWTTSSGDDYWELDYDVDGDKHDGVATLQIMDQRGRLVVVGATLVGGAGVVEVGRKLDRDSSGDGDWDD